MIHSESYIFRRISHSFRLVFLKEISMKARNSPKSSDSSKLTFRRSNFCSMNLRLRNFLSASYSLRSKYISPIVVKKCAIIDTDNGIKATAKSLIDCVCGVTSPPC